MNLDKREITTKERFYEEMSKISIKKLIKKLAQEENKAEIQFGNEKRDIATIKDEVKKVILSWMWTCRSEEDWDTELDVGEI